MSTREDDLDRLFRAAAPERRSAATARDTAELVGNMCDPILEGVAEVLKPRGFAHVAMYVVVQEL